MCTSYNCGQWCCPARAQRPEQLVTVMPERKICSVVNCIHCKEDTRHACRCSCHRNQAILHSLALLFRCSIHYVVSTLCRLAYLEAQTLMGTGSSSPLDGIKAPYTKAQDLAINDSIYDRCDEVTDPLDLDNAYKVMRLMFLTPVLQPDQYRCLVGMLQKLNARANGRVNLDWLIYTIAMLRLDAFVCSLLRQDARAARLYNAQLCRRFCQPYVPVHITEEEAKPQKRQRERKAKARGRAATEAHARKRGVRKAPLYCTRRPIEETASVRYSGSPVSQTASSQRNSVELPRMSKSPGAGSGASEKDSRRASRNSNSIGVRLQGGTPTE
ncbi:uncharacterized protein DMAD_02075 [Drosophila madeirensis]|uniref:Uncharacterized protein n=1 Tax=Drosophila madeirensis TaxID=30013 RepID=A0AAU9G4J8_DROMD